MYYPLCFRSVTERSICDMDIIIPLLPVYAPFNGGRLSEFLNNTKNGTPDSIRVIVYDIEGQPGIRNLFFDGKKITVVFDYTKKNHNYDIPKIQIFEGNNIQVNETIKNVKYILRDNTNDVVELFGYALPRTS